MADTITVEAPAKINLWLSVLGRRDDGYHRLRMVNTLVDHCDIVEVELGGEQIIVECDHPSVPLDQTNLAVRAARALLENIKGPKPGVKIRIDKRIPVAGGLGGGSSDAASVLLALDRLLDLKTDGEKLKRLGLGIGADVPFFLFGSPAIVEGIGENFFQIGPLPDWTYVLATPRLEVKAAWAYRKLDQMVFNDKLRLTKPAQSDILVYLRESTLSTVPDRLINDLEAPVIGAYPIIARIKRCMLDFGAVASVMSGSGPTVIGLYGDPRDAILAEQKLKQKFRDLFLVLAKTKVIR